LDWGIILLVGIILGFMMAILRERSSKQKRSPPQALGAGQIRDNVPDDRHNYPDDRWRMSVAGNINVATGFTTFRDSRRYDLTERLLEHGSGRTVRREVVSGGTQGLSVAPRLGSGQVITKTLLENWKRSIVGLIKSADKNLGVAKLNLEVGNYSVSVQAAVTSVENISCALIHCYSGKPDYGSGQEEALRMLARRFKGDEKSEFEKAIDSVAYIYDNRMISKYLLMHNPQEQLFAQVNARQILESASEVVSLFKRIINGHFAPEIPELDEACPKCHSLDIYVSGFNEERTNCGCNVCHNTWTEPR